MVNQVRVVLVEVNIYDLPIELIELSSYWAKLLQDVPEQYKGSARVDFDLEDLREKTQYVSDYSLHFNREEYLNLLKIGNSWNQIRRYFDRAYNAPKNIELSQLEAIKEILKI